MSSEIVFIKFKSDKELDKRRREAIASIIANTSQQILDSMPDHMKDYSAIVDAKLCTCILDTTPDYLVDELYVLLAVDIRKFMTANRVCINGIKGN